MIFRAQLNWSTSSTPRHRVREKMSSHDYETDFPSSSSGPLFPELFRPSKSRKKLPPSSVPPGASLGVSIPAPKNAVVTLNEMKPGLEYVTVEQRGPVHLPTFVVEVEVNGEKFRGEGR